MSHEAKQSQQNQRSQLLEFNYAQIEISTGKCITTFTSSYQIPSSFIEYVEIPVWNDEYDYRGKYYNLNGDQLWYWDSAFTQLWEECPSHNV